MMIHYSIKIHGNVQGVFFRASTMQAANKRKITGTVQNIQDGIVHIIAEGTEEDIKSFTDWCKIGPPGAQVDHIDIEKGDVVSYQGFKILH